MTDPVLPPIQREAHERIVREAVAAERQRCERIVAAERLGDGESPANPLLRFEAARVASIVGRQEDTACISFTFGAERDGPRRVDLRLPIEDFIWLRDVALPFILLEPTSSP